jgi:hypothetical protein
MTAETAARVAVRRPSALDSAAGAAVVPALVSLAVLTVVLLVN